jgi:tetratricopeptide (TPR) repeat protein
VKRIRKFRSALLGSIFFFILPAGCDRMITSRNDQILKDADRKATQGDYLRAVNLYEAALDDSPRCADIHYKLALLYDDKMNDPLNALHHFKRYLTVAPTGARAREVKEFMKRDEIALATSLSGDAVVTRTEAARLKNENLNLRREMEDRILKAKAASERPPGTETQSERTSKKAGNRKYVVQPGDTLYSISRKFYKSSSRWTEIREANKHKLGESGKLQPGETLTIP